MKIVLGTANLDTPYGLNKGNFLSVENFKLLVSNMSNLGIVALDTSPNYGQAEEICNQVLDRNSLIFTKHHLMKSHNTQQETKLERGKFRIVYLIHNWEELNNSDRYDGLKKFQRMIDEGVSVGLGISTYFDLELPPNFTTNTNLYLQLPINCLNQRNLDALKVLKGAFPQLVVIARSIFHQGLLLRETKELRFSKHKDVKRFKQIAEKMNISPLEMCLRFIKEQDTVDMILVGVDTYSQMVEIVQTLKQIEKGPISINWKALSSEDNELIDPRLW